MFKYTSLPLLRRRLATSTGPGATETSGFSALLKFLGSQPSVAFGFGGAIVTALLGFITVYHKYTSEIRVLQKELENSREMLNIQVKLFRDNNRITLQKIQAAERVFNGEIKVLKGETKAAVEKLHDQERVFNGEIKAAVAEAQVKTAEKFLIFGYAEEYDSYRKRLEKEEKDKEDAGKEK